MADLGTVWASEVGCNVPPPHNKCWRTPAGWRTNRTIAASPRSELQILKRIKDIVYFIVWSSLWILTWSVSPRPRIFSILQRWRRWSFYIHFSPGLLPVHLEGTRYQERKFLGENILFISFEKSPETPVSTILRL